MIFWLISFALVAAVVGLVAATYYGGYTVVDDYDYGYGYGWDSDLDPNYGGSGFGDEFSDSSLDDDSGLFSTKKMLKLARRELWAVAKSPQKRGALMKRYDQGYQIAIGIFGAAAGLGAVEL